MSTNRPLQRIQRDRGRGGFVLPLVLVLISLSFAGWALLYGSTAMSIRQQQARGVREVRAQWTARATAQALRALYTRIAALEVFESELEWEETVTRGAESRLFTVHATRLLTHRWQVDVSLYTADEGEDEEMPSGGG